MLERDHLLAELRTFADPEYEHFAGYPATRDAARRAWATAFDRYVSEIEEDIPRPPPAPDQHPALLLAGVQDAFYADLDLATSMSAATSAADFAGAWRTGIAAITPAAVATDSAATSWQFISFTNVTGQHATLLATLTTLFSTPTMSTLQRLTDIADAFHAATDGLIASATRTPSGGSPTPATMGVR